MMPPEGFRPSYHSESDQKTHFYTLHPPFPASLEGFDLLGSQLKALAPRLRLKLKLMQLVAECGGFLLEFEPVSMRL